MRINIQSVILNRELFQVHILRAADKCLNAKQYLFVICSTQPTISVSVFLYAEMC
jgi:hypothetical protein